MYYNGSFNIISSMFTNNTAGTYGGVILAVTGSMNITSSRFTNNTALNGGVMHAHSTRISHCFQ